MQTSTTGVDITPQSLYVKYKIEDHVTIETSTTN
jgi:hypothetical protein